MCTPVMHVRILSYVLQILTVHPLSVERRAAIVAGFLRKSQVIIECTDDKVIISFK